ncbi:hypothetical protein [Streptomyces sp. MST-110588]|uniref:hypothetical protein n=1 Tax=Streptomyces sp. MST-110588 TaxID=2833628 RepID=UPI001F5D59EE|nr:hypothetical protein [Streptomyces sp. MST-110588]UNO42329.1 hypothetical protein KGS77_25910 [Streptomyces sp. MST-110588]
MNIRTRTVLAAAVLMAVAAAPAIPAFTSVMTPAASSPVIVSDSTDSRPVNPASTGPTSTGPSSTDSSSTGSTSTGPVAIGPTPAGPASAGPMSAVRAAWSIPSE